MGLRFPTCSVLCGYLKVLHNNCDFLLFSPFPLPPVSFQASHYLFQPLFILPRESLSKLLVSYLLEYEFASVSKEDSAYYQRAYCRDGVEGVYKAGMSLHNPPSLLLILQRERFTQYKTLTLAYLFKCF